MKAALEDEFLILDRKKRPPVDDKILKRKIKAEEKKVIRELKKDTIAIQSEKSRVKDQKRTKVKKSTYRGGNAPVDETFIPKAKKFDRSAK